MAFDWTSVEGYEEGMTPEQMVGLLENYEVPTPEPQVDLKGYIPKKRFDEVASELSAAKKQLKSRMSEEEAKEADRQAAEEAMKAELDSLRREKTLSTHKASFLAQGYDDKMAEEAANALTDGDTETVFAIMAKQRAAQEKALRAQILKETPVPPAGDPDVGEQTPLDPFLLGFGAKK